MDCLYLLPDALSFMYGEHIRCFFHRGWRRLSRLSHDVIACYPPMATGYRPLALNSGGCTHSKAHICGGCFRIRWQSIHTSHVEAMDAGFFD